MTPEWGTRSAAARLTPAGCRSRPSVPQRRMGRMEWPRMPGVVAARVLLESFSGPSGFLLSNTDCCFHAHVYYVYAMHRSCGPPGASCARQYHYSAWPKAQSLQCPESMHRRPTQPAIVLVVLYLVFPTNPSRLQT